MLKDCLIFTLSPNRPLVICSFIFMQNDDDSESLIPNIRPKVVLHHHRCAVWSADHSIGQEENLSTYWEFTYYNINATSNYGQNGSSPADVSGQF